MGVVWVYKGYHSEGRTEVLRFRIFAAESMPVVDVEEKLTTRRIIGLW